MEWLKPLSKLTSFSLEDLKAFNLQAAPYMQLSSLCSGLTHLQLTAWEGSVRQLHTLTNLRELELDAPFGNDTSWGRHLTLSTLCRLTGLYLCGYEHDTLCLEGLAQLRTLDLLHSTAIAIFGIEILTGVQHLVVQDISGTLLDLMFPYLKALKSLQVLLCSDSLPETITNLSLLTDLTWGESTSVPLALSTMVSLDCLCFEGPYVRTSETEDYTEFFTLHTDRLSQTLLTRLHQFNLDFWAGRVETVGSLAELNNAMPPNFCMHLGTQLGRQLAA